MFIFLNSAKGGFLKRDYDVFKDKTNAMKCIIRLKEGKEIKCGEYKEHFLIRKITVFTKFLRRRPLEAVVIITAKKEDVRRSSIKSEKSV